MSQLFLSKIVGVFVLIHGALAPMPLGHVNEHDVGVFVLIQTDGALAPVPLGHVN